MAQRKTKKAAAKSPQEPDGVYFLKLVFYLVVGSLWVRVSNGRTYQIPIPAGLLIGLACAMHEKLQIDRKIEYAVLVIAMFVGFWLPLGITIAT